MTARTEGRPALESGGRLTRDEFHRRYCARPDVKKAELVRGVVYVASPVNFDRHGGPHTMMMGWLFAFAAKTPGLLVGDNVTVYLDDETEVQPDACMFWDPPRPASGHRRPDDYVEGPPVLVVEIAASSASYDLHDKKEAYRRAGVPEYIAWRTVDRAIDWFHLRDGQYVPLPANDQGMIESEVLPGLRLPVAAMLAGDATGVLAALGVTVE